MRIALGTDHAGFHLKEAVKELLEQLGHEVLDFGCYSPENCDYPDYVMPAARAVSEETCDRAVVFGGSGNGEAIAANRFHGVRCALCWNEDSARLARQHNNANVMSLGARLTDEALALKLVGLWLDTEFEGGRHKRRILKIDERAVQTRAQALAKSSAQEAVAAPRHSTVQSS
jgi:ribose 5-phosphate isomerase B